jgi:hypothetical protein
MRTVLTDKNLKPRKGLNKLGDAIIFDIKWLGYVIRMGAKGFGLPRESNHGMAPTDEFNSEV